MSRVCHEITIQYTKNNRFSRQYSVAVKKPDAVKLRNLKQMRGRESGIKKSEVKRLTDEIQILIVVKHKKLWQRIEIEILDALRRDLGLNDNQTYSTRIR